MFDIPTLNRITKQGFVFALVMNAELETNVGGAVDDGGRRGKIVDAIEFCDRKVIQA